MDVYCKRCGEPWDLHGVEHGDMTPTERRRFWAGKGCPACFGKRPCRRKVDCEECPEWDGEIFVCGAGRMKALAKKPFRAEATTILQGILGSDLDGLAAELEDMEFQLGKEFWE